MSRASGLPSFARPDDLRPDLRALLLAMSADLSPRARGELWRQAQRGHIPSAAYLRRELSMIGGGELGALRGVGATILAEWRYAQLAADRATPPQTAHDRLLAAMGLGGRS